MSKRINLISGITGQDGSYLAENLVEKGEVVIGLTRNKKLEFRENIKHLSNYVTLMHCSYTQKHIDKIIKEIEPHRIFNLAGQVYVNKSWDLVNTPVTSTGSIPIYFLNAILKINRKIKFFQASSSEIFGEQEKLPIDENSSISPTNPYGCSKALAHNMVRIYREQYGLHAVNGILFNHDSHRRPTDFISKRLIKGA